MSHIVAGTRYHLLTKSSNSTENRPCGSLVQSDVPSNKMDFTHLGGSPFTTIATMSNIAILLPVLALDGSGGSTAGSRRGTLGSPSGFGKG